MSDPGAFLRALLLALVLVSTVGCGRDNCLKADIAYDWSSNALDRIAAVEARLASARCVDRQLVGEPIDGWQVVMERPCGNH